MALLITIELSAISQYVSEFELNYPQFYINFPSEHSSVDTHEQGSFFDPLFGNDENDSDFDNWESFSSLNADSLLTHSAQTQVENSDDNQLLKRRELKINFTFTHSSHGELRHFWIDWRLDKASMKKYMLKYVKQEKYAVNRVKEKNEIVHRWKCHHAEKYDNWRKQSDQVTNKKVLQEKINVGNLFAFSVNCKRKS